MAPETGFKPALLLILHELDFYVRYTTMNGEKVIFQSPFMEQGQELPTQVSYYLLVIQINKIIPK